MLTLAVSDNGDGSGGVATVSGSAGAANSVYYTPWSAIGANLAWVLAGSITGDGTVSLPVGVGYFLVQLISNSVLGPVAKPNFTDSTDSAHYRCLTGVLSRLSELSMIGLSVAQLKVQWLPRAQDVDLAALPLVFIAPPGFEVEDGETTGTDDFLMPVAVAIVVAQNNDSVANLKPVLKWRDQIRRAVVNQQGVIPGVPELFWAKPRVMNVADPASFLNLGILVSVLGFGMKVRQTRGLT